MKFKYQTIGAILFILVAVVLFEALVLVSDTDEPFEIASVEAYAEEMIEKCASADYRPFCYEKTIPQLLDYIALGEVFDVIRLVRRKDFSYRFCHVLAHEIGEREVAKDPDNWIDVIAKGPADGLCSNGFIHGAAVSRFSKEVLTNEEIDAAAPELEIACEPRGEWQPTGLDQAICYHGVGHVLVHLTDADIEKSLEICEVIALKSDGRDYRQVCDEGVFMQLFQPLEPEDFALIERLEEKPVKENLASFCKSYGDIPAQAACWREGWPLYDSELNTAEGIHAFCSDSPNERQKGNCYNTVLAIKGRSSLNNPGTHSDLCNGFDEEIQAKCFFRAATAYIEEDKESVRKAVEFCGYADNATVRDGCYGNLIGTAHFVFHRGSPQLAELCNVLPAPWDVRCREQTL